MVTVNTSSLTASSGTSPYTATATSGPAKATAGPASATSSPASASNRATANVTPANNTSTGTSPTDSLIAAINKFIQGASSAMKG